MAIKKVLIDHREFNISYEILNASSKKDIVFLHGWGSNKELMKSSFGGFFNEFRHIYIDMPGFGKSDNTFMLDTKKYMIILQQFLIDIKSSSNIIVGHSFGGKVATLLNPAKLILLSSSGILEPKSFMVKFKIVLFKILKNIGFGGMYSIFASKDVNRMSPAMYETFKNIVNEDFRDNFKEYKYNALVLWGDKDRATSISSGIEIASLIKKSNFYTFDGDHYFFLHNKEEVANKIEEFLL